MTTATRVPAIRRIVVTLNSPETGRPSLDVAVRLAAVLGAELEGVFVEDINLIRLSELPFLREIRASSLVEEVVNAQRMERDLRALARQAEQMFLQAAQAMGVGCSFRVWRGRAAVETLSSSFEADIITLRGGRALTVSRTHSSISGGAPAMAPAIQSINVLFDASPAAERALTTAGQLAANLGTGIRVLVIDRQTPPAVLRERAETILAAQGVHADFVPLAAISAAALTDAMGAPTGNTVLIAGVDNPLFSEAGLGPCLDGLTCPVLFVR